MRKKITLIIYILISLLLISCKSSDGYVNLENEYIDFVYHKTDEYLFYGNKIVECFIRLNTLNNSEKTDFIIPEYYELKGEKIYITEIEIMLLAFLMQI